MMIARCVILLLLVVEVCQASCVLSDEDWTPIRTAYLERNTYNPLKSICNDTYQTRSRHIGQHLVQRQPQGCNHQQLLQCIDRGGLSSSRGDSSISTLCKLFYIAPLANRTTTYQLAYYANQDDLKCMRRYGVCESFKAANWDSCPLTVKDTLYFMDSSHTAYTCETVYPSASERCELSFERAFLDYCPLPTEFEKNATVIIVMCVIGPFILLALGCIVYRFRRNLIYIILLAMKY
ncbi:hypothetical protein BASA81_017380 [Batrachochytrium salamandrivorans]|nr:hypothetical protein BASA81_017380 [Batrachochytrium salamandrivorans]